ncbi:MULTISPECIES: O-antigen ligase family protein [Brevibacillus]|uniref:O-antigen ligase family protein n=1 Tax=Brevibacillus TaxID=55080 RepID=UPI00156B163F|nr:O-antigen ligase family protein [Brevibacillus sp. RS1.1]NRR03483.1 O-antigen ligase family protein [Brevibacillus sp. RS1.1]
MGRVINLISLIVISLLFIYTPYLRGLFFDNDMYLVQFILCTLFMMNIVVVWKQPEIQLSPYLLVFVIPLSQIFSFFGTETLSGSLDNMIKWFTYSAFFILLVYIKQSDKSRKLERMLPVVFQITGIWIAFFAIFGLGGWVEYQDIFLGNRLSGTFQYPNTFAAVISAFWLFSMIMLSKKNGSYLYSIFYGLPILAFGVSFFFADSRGVMLFFPVAWLVGLCLLRGKNQINYFVYSIVSIVASLLVYNQMKNQLSSGAGTSVMNVFIIATVLLVGILLISRIVLLAIFKRTKEKSFYRQWILPVIVIALGIAGGLDLQNKGLLYQNLPESIQVTISNTNMETSSVLGRTSFYEDALRISKESALFGFGGDSWKILYPKYQTVPYISNEVHSGYLEVVISYGWVGLLIFVGFFAMLFFLAFRSRQSTQDNDKFVLITASLTSLSILFIHAFIDFDFSFGSVWFIIFWLFIMAVPEDAFKSLESKVLAGNKKIHIMRLAHICCILLVAGSVFFSIRFYYADKQVRSLSQNTSLAEAEQKYENAISANPYKSDYHIKLAEVYASETNLQNRENNVKQVEKHLQKAEELEPNNSTNFLLAGKVYALLGEIEKADASLRKSLLIDRFNINAYDSVIQLEAQLAIYLKQNQKNQDAQRWATKALEDYKQYRKTVDPFIDQSIPDKRPLELQKSTQLFISQCYLIVGEYKKAIEHLYMITDDNPYDILETAYAVRVVATEALGQYSEAGRLTKIMLEKSNEFPKRVILLRPLVSK